MSSYYKSKCCGEQVRDLFPTIPNDDRYWVCQKCNCICEVTATIDSPGGVPKEDCQVCGREDGHIKPIK